MKLVIQRVSSASVEVAGRVVGEIGAGLLVLLGLERGDRVEEVVRLAGRVAALRVFPDERGRFDRSVVEVGGAVLVVSQFTLCADTRRGRRPGFDAAMNPAEAEPLYRRFIASLAEAGLEVREGAFGALMSVRLTNEGPATFLLEGRDPPAGADATGCGGS